MQFFITVLEYSFVFAIKPGCDRRRSRSKVCHFKYKVRGSGHGQVGHASQVGLRVVVQQAADVVHPGWQHVAVEYYPFSQTAKTRILRAWRQKSQRKISANHLHSVFKASCFFTEKHGTKEQMDARTGCGAEKTCDVSDLRYDEKYMQLISVITYRSTLLFYKTNCIVVVFLSNLLTFTNHQWQTSWKPSTRHFNFVVIYTRGSHAQPFPQLFAALRLFLLITAASEFKICLFLALLLLSHTPSLACSHASAWPCFC